MRRYQYSIQANQNLDNYDSLDPDRRPLRNPYITLKNVKHKQLLNQNLIISPTPNIRSKDFQKKGRNQNIKKIQSLHSFSSITPSSLEKHQITNTQLGLIFQSHSFLPPLSDFNETINSPKFKTVNQSTNLKIIDLQRKSSQEESKLISLNFVSSFLLEKTSHYSALVIQTTWRLYRTKIHWKREIAIRLAVQKRISSFTFRLWRLLTIRNPRNLRVAYDSFKQSFFSIGLQLPNHHLVNFNIFYISNDPFMDDILSQEKEFRLINNFYFPLKRKIFHHWHITSQRICRHRRNLLFTKYTCRKSSVFGPIFNFFSLWRRFAAFQKLSRKDTINYISIDKDQFTDVSVRWIVLEAKFNQKLSRIRRADEHYIKTLIKTATLALFNLKISELSHCQDLESADLFRNRRLMILAHRAWLKTMAMSNYRHQHQKDIIRAWYTRTYTMKNLRLRSSIAADFFHQYHLVSQMNQWLRLSQIGKLQRTLLTLHVQSKASLSFMIIFLLQGSYEEFFQCFCFRTWMIFKRSRKRWKKFQNWSSELSSTNILEYNTLAEMRRSATLHLMARPVTPTASFFPRQHFLGIELALQAIRNISNSAKRESLWHFTTDIPVSGKGKEKQEWETLARALLVAIQIHDGKSINVTQQIQPNPRFEKERTMRELIQLADSNIKLMKIRTPMKITRDHSILNTLISHMAAEEVKEAYPGFVATETKDLMQLIRSNYSERLEPIYIYPDIEESYLAIRKQILSAGDRIKINHDIKRKKLKDEKLPNSFKQKKNTFISNVVGLVNDLGKLSIQAISPVMKNSMIHSFVPSNGNSMKKIQNEEWGENGKYIQCLKDSTFTSLTNCLRMLFEINVNSGVETLKGNRINMSNFDPMDEIDISKKIQMRRNAKHFAQDLKKLSLLTYEKVQLETFSIAENSNSFTSIGHLVENVLESNQVSAILTIFSEIMNSGIRCYLAETPFPVRIDNDANEVKRIRAEIWKNLKLRNQKIELPNGNKQILLENSKVRSFSSSLLSLSSLKSGSSSLLLETLSSKNALIICFLLPYIIDWDLLPLFIQNEIKPSEN